jgi:hypothetical protein
MGHVRQELGLGPICQLGSFSCSSVLLDGVTQIEHHLIDLRLQGIHLSARLDRDEPSEIAVHSCRRNLGESTHLRGQVSSHGVDRHSASQTNHRLIFMRWIMRMSRQRT